MVTLISHLSTSKEFRHICDAVAGPNAKRTTETIICLRLMEIDVVRSSR